MLVLLLGCGGVEVRRDLSGVSPGRVGFDDMCGLQATFDAIETGYTAPPRLVFAVDLAGGRTAGGRARWAFETTSQRQVVRRVLTENWSRLPEPLAAAKQIEIEIAWTERAGIERVVTDRDSTLIVDGRSTRLPYHPCLSELLYGAPLYRRRREVLGLPLELPPPPPPPPSPPPASAPVVRPSPPVPTPQPTPAAVPAPGFRPAPTASPSTGVPAATPSPSPAPTFKPAPPSQPPP